jgi:hypothetical protein
VSFIYREEALAAGKSGRPTIVPAHPERSNLIARVMTTDLEKRMPYRSPPLTANQIELLKRWIKEGAHWGEHWAFVAPKKQVLPAVTQTQWPRRPLDRFVLARIEQAGLQPAPEASKAELLRRVSFDLTGLPPTSEELSAFSADTAPNAYERQVDRLLSSPHFGERWATLWLDLARYADSRGYEKDLSRTMWPYRDWVIDAFNRNVPYDQFVIAQLAGDLLPDATLADWIATAFQRQTPVNDEGGTDDEEFRLAAVMDRVATTWSVLNAVTINCVQCHSHPYDPIRQTEYYKFLAFYNTSRDADLFEDTPLLYVPNEPSQRMQAMRLQHERFALLREIVNASRAASQATAWQFLPTASAIINEPLRLQRILARLQQPEPSDSVAQVSSRQRQFREELVRQTKAAMPSAQPLPIVAGEVRAPETIPAQSLYELVAGPLVEPLTALRIEVLPVHPEKTRDTPEDGFFVDSIDVSVVAPDGHEEKIGLRFLAPDDEDNLDHFAAYSKLFYPRWTVAIPTKPIPAGTGAHIKIQLSHSREIPKSAAPRRIRLDVSGDSRWTHWADDLDLSQKLARLDDIKQNLAGMPGVWLPVMQEQRPQMQRVTRQFERGNFLTKVGPALVADVPALFPPLPRDARRDRLTMARWFFQPGQPLTARVAVNRFWEQIFGIGLVEKLEDFGSAGEPPSHPELLDWLALHFQNDLHWNMKAFLGELVTSATYRQSAKCTPALLEQDARNRLLARGPQQRLTAEMVRDQALLASGLLTRTIGGPPVRPPQPAGVLMTVYNDEKWVDATGPNRYRRAIYTYLKRSAIYPSFLTFDASARDVSLARRVSTNTPLQALVTLNDPVYMEAAQALARSMLHGSGTGDRPDRRSAQERLADRLNRGGRSVLSRDLTAQEMSTLQALYVDALPLVSATKNPGRTSDLLQSEELAALTTVASVLLNLDAALTR